MELSAIDRLVFDLEGLSANAHRIRVTPRELVHLVSRTSHTGNVKDQQLMLKGFRKVSD